MKSKKYDQLKHILNLFGQLSDRNSYKQYRNAFIVLPITQAKRLRK